MQPAVNRVSPLAAAAGLAGRALAAGTLQDLGYKMVIWPVSSLRVANRAQQDLYAELAQHGATTDLVARMQTRAELYDLIDLASYESLDASIVASAVPQAESRQE